jgi:aldehyde:ferredoxin oxidoreductase
MNGLYDAAGRGGLGAVMGSKNLKAIAVRGHKSPPIVNPDGVKELRDWLAANFDLLLKSFSTYGTGAPMDAGELSGNLPVRNFRDGLFPGVELINARVLKDTIRIRMDACFGCTVRCKKVVEVKSPYTVDSAYGGPEYETLAGLGSNCGIDNLAAIAKGNELCNAYSLDTISTGAVVAFAMECFENGLLTTKDTDGLELRFGNAEAMLRVIELISQRKGIGDLLAEGTARAAQKIGRGAEKFAIHSKGLEAGMHEPRLKPGLGLGYMVNPHGADHCTNMHDSLYVAAEQIKELMPLGITEPVPAEDIGPRKVALFRTVQFRQIINDSLVLCSMLPYSFRQIADVTAAVTGWNTGVMEHFRIAERILTMARLFNLREGFEADDDRLPARFFEPKTDGALSNKPLEQAKMEKARSYYYTLMGWNPRTGVPLPEKLEELGIS